MGTKTALIQNYLYSNVLRDFGQRKYIHIGSIKPSALSISSLSSSPSSSPGAGKKPSSSDRKSISSPDTQTTVTSHEKASAAVSSPDRVSHGNNFTRQTEQKSNAGNMRAVNKQWVHPPEALLRGHIVYNVKFLGECEVDQPKGTDIVKAAITKMKFSRHIRKADGQKSQKVELTISADGVTVQEPKNKMIMHQYPLHRISYCADDKSDKRMFTFIAKEQDSNKHFCYVFDSDKCSEEITLTVGQAFDLAYRRFLESSGKTMDLKKQILLLQRKVQSLQQENVTLKKRITHLETIKDKTEIDQYKALNSLMDLTYVPGSPAASGTSGPAQPLQNGTKETTERKGVVGRRLENLVLYENAPTLQANGTHSPKHATPLLSPPPSSGKSRSHSTPPQPTAHILSTFHPRPNHSPIMSPDVDLLGAEGFSAPPSDPFGMGAFNPRTSHDYDQAILTMDAELIELQAGFSRGLSFGTDDFDMDEFDSLSSRT